MHGQTFQEISRSKRLYERRDRISLRSELHGNARLSHIDTACAEIINKYEALQFVCGSRGGEGKGRNRCAYGGVPARGHFLTSRSRIKPMQRSPVDVISRYSRFKVSEL